jgi:hypothetical protein
MTANKTTGVNAGGRRQLPMRTRWAARVAQFCRSAAHRAPNNNTQQRTMHTAQINTSTRRILSMLLICFGTHAIGV